MEAVSINHKTIQLTKNGEILGELVYQGMFSQKAEIYIGNSLVYSIAPVGFFGTTTSIKRDGIQIATLVINWNGKIVIAFEGGQEYIMKTEGFLRSKYILESKNKDKLMELDSAFQWKTFSYHHTIKYDEKPQDSSLVLLAVYAANYYATTMSAVW